MSCSPGATPTPPPAQTATLAPVEATAQPANTAGTFPLPADIPTPANIQPSANVSGAPPQTQPPNLPLPTPHPYNSDWAQDRIDAVVALYRPTPAGEALLRSLDLRQMRGEPGFFGSYGFDDWAGAGEAKPIGVMHELGHSYWGGFPVIGRPELSWERQEGQDVSSALASYHRDILAFMGQPPDEYELLRQRLRNLPNVSADNTEPILHSLEADTPYTIGGDLALAPPVLRKYWGHFLSEGPFGSWENAAGWFQSLTQEQRATAGKYLGFEHLDLRQYPGLEPYTPPGAPLASNAEVLEREELQRLTDLAQNFDLLLGDSQLDEDFRFWRDYLRDKVDLHRSHPDYLGSLGLPRARDLSDGLKFVAGLYGSPTSKALMLADRIGVQPFLVNLLPAVDNQTLVKLFAGGPALPKGATLQATASFVDRLQRFGAVVDGVLAEGRKSPESGATALQDFLDETGYEQEQDLQLFFDLFFEADRSTARSVMSAVTNETVRALMPPVPVQLRTIYEPVSLLGKLDVTAQANGDDLRRGIALLIDEPSGNYRVDEPFLERLYDVMAERSKSSPHGAARVMAETPFPLEGMILRQPDAASVMLSSDLGLGLDLVKNSDGVIAPPARIIHRLMFSDPALAAALVTGLDQAGESQLVAESLSYFAYDQSRSERFPELPISVSQDGTFLKTLLERQGPDWLQQRLTNAVELYRQRTTVGEVPAEFLARYRETLDASAKSVAGEDRERLLTIILAAFG